MPNLLPPDLRPPAAREARRSLMERAGALRDLGPEHLAEVALVGIVAVAVAAWYWSSLPHAPDPPAPAPRPAAVEQPPLTPAAEDTPLPRLPVAALAAGAQRAGHMAALAAARGPATAGRWVVQVDGRRLPVRTAPARRTSPTRAAARTAPAAAAPAPAPAPAATAGAVTVVSPLGAVAYRVISTRDDHMSRVLEPREPASFGARSVGGWPSNSGMDLAAPAGTTVVAPVTGTVTYAYDRSGIGPTTPGYGVGIETGQGLAVFLTHLDRLTVRVGQTVAAGQPIGVIGRWFTSIPNHVHVGMGRSWATPGLSAGIDPARYLRG